MSYNSTPQLQHLEGVIHVQMHCINQACVLATLLLTACPLLAAPVSLPDYFKGLIVFLMVDTHDKHWGISTGSWDDDSLSTTFQVSLKRDPSTWINHRNCIIYITVWFRYLRTQVQVGVWVLVYLQKPSQWWWRHQWIPQHNQHQHHPT